jgi:hypothetical protein
MTRLIRSRLTFANVTSVVALFVALGGSSYAALNLPKGSVGTKQLRNNAVTSPKVKRGSLLISDFRRSQRARLRGPRGRVGPQGPVGPQGAQGPQGATGAPGAPGATNVVVRYGTPVTIDAATPQNLPVSCAPGERALGGGVAPQSGDNDDARMVYSTPMRGSSNASNGDIPDGWNTRVSITGAVPYTAIPRVVCASP